MTSNGQAPSARPFGDAIAAAVADLLDRGGRILWGWNAHWMLKKGDRFVYERLKDTPEEIFAAPQKAAFAAWLAQQSPYSLDAHVRPACQDTVEVITHALLADAVAQDAGINDPTPYGPALAREVAEALDRGAAMMHAHRDYGGMGLARRGDGYAYGPVYDGELMEERVFPTKAAFVTWLAAQSDATLSGREAPSPFDWDNQRITRARLRAVIAAQPPG